MWATKRARAGSISSLPVPGDAGHLREGGSGLDDDKAIDVGAEQSRPLRCCTHAALSSPRPSSGMPAARDILVRSSPRQHSKNLGAADTCTNTYSPQIQ